ncbi:MAG: RNA methyltransferase [Solobacterium sp.]|nr:RNA methyltransferase [Solobacterium sp.]
MKKEYLERMEKMLGEEYPKYLECMNETPRRALRVNTLRTAPEVFAEVYPYDLEPTGFAANGYYTNETSPSSSLLYRAGVYYMQEASASAAVTMLDPQPGMRVLDLCAAPGSKTTQILEALGNSGMLAANEIVPKRASVLLENVIRHGADNCLVLNESPKRIAETFPEAFDAVLTDAPCSGEGMFRKDPEAASEWTENVPAGCALRQAEILESAYLCLRPGGRLLYSTCTFSMEENEEQILAFVKKHPDMKIADAKVTFGRPGFPIGDNTAYSRRIFPMDGGEGHFAALLIKDGSGESSLQLLPSDRLPKEAVQFLKETGAPGFPYYNVHGEAVYGSTHPFVKTGRCRVIRSFTRMGEVQRGRFEPDHAFFVSAGQTMRSYDLNEEEAWKYIHGEQLPCVTEKGWVRVTYQGFPLGGARSDGHALKNKYPKYLRTR